jgi:dTDP-4-dehydrorhamnose reductase
MYVVVGANGFLGSYILKSVIKLTKEPILAVSHSKTADCIDSDRITWVCCDISDRKAVIELNSHIQSYGEPCNIIYLAAYHNPDNVEKNFSFAWNINIISLAFFLNTIGNVKTFFYPSTDSVYGNSIDGYHFKESDNLTPVNKYGMQKKLAEQLVLAYGYNVVRFTFLIGPSLLSTKQHFYDKIVSSLQCGQKVEMFSDSIRSSIDFAQGADLLVKVVYSHTAATPKVLNICADQDLSKYDVGLLIAKKIGVSDKYIVPVSCKEKNNIFAAPRANSTLIDNSLLKKALGIDSIIIKL